MKNTAVVLIAIIISACASTPKGVYTLPPQAEITPLSFASVDHLFENRKVIQLGEGIHMTREFPQARTQLAHRLFANHGFDLFLFEGSTIDAWLASDNILNNANPTESDYARARDMAFPPIWRAPEYNEVFKKPFYVASYDLQPGMGALKTESIPELLKAVSKYAQAPKMLKKISPILSLLCDRKNGFPNRTLKQKKNLEHAIADLKPWFKKAAAEIEKKFPGSPHARVLQFIPKAMQAQVELWEAHQNDPKGFKAFQETRDRLGAQNIIQMANEVSKSGKVIVWAHHVHVFHNTLGKARRALGTDLKAALGPQVYTIGLFANTGESYSLAEMEDIVEGPLKPGNEYGLESRLLRFAGTGNIFADFSELRADGQTWVDETLTMRREVAGVVQSMPGKDFDGAMLIQKISKPKLPWSK